MRVPFDLRGYLVRCSYEEGVMFAPLLASRSERREAEMFSFTAEELRELADAMDHIEAKFKEKKA